MPRNEFSKNSHLAQIIRRSVAFDHAKINKIESINLFKSQKTKFFDTESLIIRDFFQNHASLVSLEYGALSSSEKVRKSLEIFLSYSWEGYE